MFEKNAKPENENEISILDQNGLQNHLTNTLEHINVILIQTNNLPPTLQIVLPLTVRSQEINHIQEIGNHHIDSLILDHFQFHDHLIFLVFDVLIGLESSVLIELHHFEDTMNFLDKKNIQDLLVILLPNVIVFVLFLDLTLEFDINSEIINLLVDLHQDHFKVCICFENNFQ